MSYARFGENSDVYVFANIAGYLECCSCRLRDAGFGVSSTFDSTDAILSHLRGHRAVGDAVPDYTFEGLEEDRLENDAWLAEENAAGALGQEQKP